MTAAPAAPPRPYPLKGDDTAAWWRGRCRTCAWHGAGGECWQGGMLVYHDAKGSQRYRPLFYTSPAAKMKCWTETRDAR